LTSCSPLTAPDVCRNCSRLSAARWVFLRSYIGQVSRTASASADSVNGVHNTNRLIKLLAGLTLAVSVMTATAAASTPARTLSQAEYQQLDSMFKRLDGVHGTSVGSFKTKESICRHTHSVSALVSDEKANCIGFAAQELAAEAVVKVEKRCDSKSTAADQLNCLIPKYRLFYRSLVGEDRALQRLERIDRVRGFSIGCVAILGGASSGVKIYGRIVKDAGQVLSNLRSHNVTRLHAAEDRLFAAENNSATGISGHYKLSTCIQAV